MAQRTDPMTPRPASDTAVPETLVAFATRRIKSALATGVIKPGERISPAGLAEELGLSHIPIREALAALAGTGYVDHARGRGYFARSLSSDDLADIYSWREVLEREAYGLAVPQLTDGDLQHMESLVASMSSLLAPADRFAYLELNREWHFTCFRRVGSQYLLRMLDYLWDSAQPYATLELTSSEPSHREHVALMPVLASRDAEAVMAGMKQHRQIRIDHVASWERRSGLSEQR